MPRSIDILTESPASVEQIAAAFGREDYWLARVAATTLSRWIRCRSMPTARWQRASLSILAVSYCPALLPGLSPET